MDKVRANQSVVQQIAALRVSIPVDKVRALRFGRLPSGSRVSIPVDKVRAPDLRRPKTLEGVVSIPVDKVRAKIKVVLKGDALEVSIPVDKVRARYP